MVRKDLQPNFGGLGAAPTEEHLLPSQTLRSPELDSSCHFEIVFDQ